MQQKTFFEGDFRPTKLRYLVKKKEKKERRNVDNDHISEMFTDNILDLFSTGNTLHAALFNFITVMLVTGSTWLRVGNDHDFW